MADSLIRYDEGGRKVYEPDGPVLTAFLLDRSPVSIIRGPWGSGTSTACCQKIWQSACEQRPMSDGKRRSRWIVTRDTYPIIQTTTLETWLYWFPEKLYGKFYWGEKPWKHELRVGDVELDVYFRAFDDGGEEGLLSLEPTGFWFNEISVPLKLFGKAWKRTGRYPPKEEGGSKWSGCLVDLNSPAANYWLPMMMGEAPLPEDETDEELKQYERPKGWAYFVQPPAMLETFDSEGQVSGYVVNPEAENLKWLEDGYYEKQVLATTKRDIDARILNKVLPMVDGDAVFKRQFRRETHVAKQALLPIEGHAVHVGLDFGRRPAAVFAQYLNGRWYIQHETIGKDMGAEIFAPMVKRKMVELYPWCRDFRVYGDPKGRDRGQGYETTAYQIFAAHGIRVMPAPVKNNNVMARLEAVEHVLTGMEAGRARILISPACRVLVMAMDGGYRFPKERPQPGEERKPVKDRHSDVVDALQYLLLGGGEGLHMVTAGGGAGRGTPVATRVARSRRRVA